MYFRINEPTLGRFHGKTMKVWVQEDVYEIDEETDEMENSIAYSRYLICFPYDKHLVQDCRIYRLVPSWKGLDFNETRPYICPTFPGWDARYWAIYLNDDQGRVVSSIENNEEALGFLREDVDHLAE